MTENDALVLEIIKHDDCLSMCAYERGQLASTLRHYSKQPVSFVEVEKLCRDINLSLNSTDKHNGFDSAAADNLRKSAQLLWDHLIAKPLKDKLKAAHNRSLVLSLDEELINFPWELLYDGKDFLCLKFNLGRLIRVKEQPVYSACRGFSGRAKMLILANPTNDLKSAYLEGVYIRNQLDRRRREVSVDFKSSSIDKMYVKKNLRDYDIVHFAGHCECVYSSAPGWVLSDGAFNSKDIIGLGQTLPLPSLIFSNACYSAGGSQDYLNYQEKTYSLACAFLFSGTRHYIGAIRRIEDSASLAFAREFYAQLVNGEAVGESLRLGRLRLIKEYGIGSVSWASHVLYGDPSFALFKLKPNKDIFGLKKWRWHQVRNLAGKFILAAGVLFIGAYFYFWLPALNPSAYFLYLKAGNFAANGENKQAILASNAAIRKNPDFLPVYPVLGQAYQRIGERGQALKVYFDYARYSEKKQDRKSLISAYTGIGWIYHLQGNYPKAFDFYNQALALSDKGKDKLNQAIALRKISVWYTDKENYAKALELLTKSSEINRERQNILEHRYNLACDYFDIGLVFMNKEDFPAAKEFYAKSLNLFAKLKLKNELSDYYFNAGEVYLFEKQYQKALDYYLRGLEIDKKQGNKPNIGSDYNMIGELYLEMGNLSEAEKSFNQAVSILIQIDAQPELASAYYNLGRLYKTQGLQDKSREYLRSAQDIYAHIDTPEYQRLKTELSEVSPPQVVDYK